MPMKDPERNFDEWIQRRALCVRIRGLFRNLRPFMHNLGCCIFIFFSRMRRSFVFISLSWSSFFFLNTFRICFAAFFFCVPFFLSNCDQYFESASFLLCPVNVKGRIHLFVESHLGKEETVNCIRKSCEKVDFF